MNQGTTSKTYYRKRIPVKHSYSSYVNTFGEKAFFWSNALFLLERNPNHDQAKSVLSGLQLSSQKLLKEFLELRVNNWKTYLSRYDYDTLYRIPGAFTKDGQEWDLTLLKDGKIVYVGTEVNDTISIRATPSTIDLETLFFSDPDINNYKV